MGAQLVQFAEARYAEREALLRRRDSVIPGARSRPIVPVAVYSYHRECLW